MNNIKKYHRIIGCCCVFLFISLGFYACDNDDNGNRNPVSNQDKNFVRDAGHANRAEIEMAELATTKAEDDEVVAFAKFMITEHTEAQNKLKDLADAKNIPMPDTLDAAHIAMKDKLSGLDGYKFDSAYISSQVSDHEKAENIFKSGADENDDEQLETYASETLKHIREHLKRAKELKEKINNKAG